MRNSLAEYRQKTLPCGFEKTSQGEQSEIQQNSARPEGVILGEPVNQLCQNKRREQCENNGTVSLMTCNTDSLFFIVTASLRLITAEFCVGRNLCEELLMCADFRMSLIHPDHLIHLIEQIETMRNQNDNGIPCQLFYVCKNLCFRLFIECREWIIENQNRPFVIQRSRKGKALRLAA